MKHRFLIWIILFLILFVPIQTSAQSPERWKTRFGIGWFSVMDFVSLFGVGFGSIDMEEGSKKENFLPLCNPNIGMAYRLNNWLDLEMQLSVGYASLKVSDAGNQLKRQAKFIYPSLMLGVSTDYWRKNHFVFYGNYSIGATMFLNAQHNKINGQNITMEFAPMANVYPICFAYGGQYGFFVETGWGAKGFVNLGCYVRF